MFKKSYRFIVQNNIIELAVWVVAFIVFAVLTPSIEKHFALCPLDALGFDHCPGCGLGRSMTFLFHGDLGQSWQMHYLGIPATALLGWRIIYLFRRLIKNQKR